jgi:hypothetical protein
MSQTDSRFHVYTALIRATMKLRLVHPIKQIAIDFTACLHIKNSCNTTHCANLVSLIVEFAGRSRPIVKPRPLLLMVFTNSRMSENLQR